MKEIFKIKDDWNENLDDIKFNLKLNSKIVKTLNGITKKQSKKNKKVNKTENGQLKTISVDSVEQNAEQTTAEEIKKECLFTPLLNRSLLQNVNNISEIPTKTKSKKAKKRKTTLVNNEEIKKSKVDDQSEKKKDANEESPKQSSSNLHFADKLRESLLGGRFRYINEQLYTIPGNKAKEIFEEDQEAFQAYHKGYKQQIEKWPFNPLDRIIKRIRRLPKQLIIADLGCGEANLAKSIPHKCFSIDLVSSQPNVIACDMANTPLDSKSVDVVVFCLSLMGINLKDFICEANRILKKNGIVFVAEIGSRFDNVKDFKKLWEHFGFELTAQDVEKKNYFYFFDFKKIEDSSKNMLSIVNCKLKPCLYKKR